MATLEDPEIEERLGRLDGWEREGDAITKSFKRDDFVGSVRFVDSLVEPARVVAPNARRTRVRFSSRFERIRCGSRTANHPTLPPWVPMNIRPRLCPGGSNAVNEPTLNANRACSLLRERFAGSPGRTA